MTFNIFKLWKQDLIDLYDMNMYNTRPTKDQIMTRALEYLHNEIDELCDDPSQDFDEIIERLHTFEKSRWFIKRAKTVCQFDYSYGMLKDDQRTDGKVVPVRLTNSAKLRLLGLGWMIIISISIIYKYLISN